MRIAILGKIGGITRWPEDVAEDLCAAGHDVVLLPTRNPLFSKRVERLLRAPAIGMPLVRWTSRLLRRFRPDLILAVGAFDQFPVELIGHLPAQADRAPLAAWIGDKFGPGQAGMANLFDFVAYTDTAMAELHKTLEFQARCGFVPLGAVLREVTEGRSRSADMVFVAAPAPNRRRLLRDLSRPVHLYGPGWQAATELARHPKDARPIGREELRRIYAGCLASLNIRNETYVLDGLNQRHFAPYVCGAPVVTDAQADVETCFDPGTETLVYRDAAELDEIHQALAADPARAARIGAAGQRRVLAEHGYRRRIAAIARMAGVG